MSPSVNPIWLVAIALIVAAVPLLIGLFSAYVKVSVVMSMVRNALGTQQVPSGLVIMALSLSITCLTMSPTLTRSFEALRAIDLSVLKDPSKISFALAKPVLQPWRDFLEKHVGKRELSVMMALEAQQSDAPHSDNVAVPQSMPPIDKIVVPPISAIDPATASIGALVPAFLISELKEGFAMAFVLLLPFLVIDLVVANVLAGLGMFMVSPVMIALPLKLILFVVADGWLLLAKGLIQSYGSTL